METISGLSFVKTRVEAWIFETMSYFFPSQVPSAILLTVADWHSAMKEIVRKFKKKTESTRRQKPRPKIYIVMETSVNLQIDNFLQIRI